LTLPWQAETRPRESGPEVECGLGLGVLLSFLSMQTALPSRAAQGTILPALGEAGPVLLSHNQ
jgi:hypothetical protein